MGQTFAIKMFSEKFTSVLLKISQGNICFPCGEKKGLEIKELKYENTFLGKALRNT